MPLLCCPMCGGMKAVIAWGVRGQMIPVPCPECAGLDVVPASADDHLAGHPLLDLVDSAARERGVA